MDYSIILINRYRQEKETGLSNQAAMTAAVQHSFGSIASSSLTTVVGLLALVFMNFKIGMDLGIVLAKGVFISMVCVITILPCLILLCDKLITKTAKRALHIPMGDVAKFSYRFRYAMPVLFIAAFFGFSLFQGNTQIAYTLESEDLIAEVFPENNMLVMVYSNEDEEQAAQLAESLESLEEVTQVLGYPNLLGKQYTAWELSDSIGDLGESFGADIGDSAALDPALLEMIYYNYYSGETYPLTMGEFLRFLSEDVLSNDTFADNIDKDMQAQANNLAKFSEPEELTSPKSIQELADFFDMDADTVKSLMLYYYMNYGGVDTGAMTLSAFSSFVIDEVASNPNYSSMFDNETLSKLDQMKTFTDVSSVTTPANYKEIADMLGMDADTVKLLFVYYYSMSDSYSPKTMTISEFVSFLQNDIMKNSMFSSYLDKSYTSQIETLEQFTDKNNLQAQRTASEIASIFEIDESMVNTIFVLYSAGDVSQKNMTLVQFIEFLNDDILNNPMFSDYFDDSAKTQLQYMNRLVQSAAAGKYMSSTQMAQMLGMTETSVTQLYLLYLSANDAAFQQEAAAMTMTLSDFLALVKTQASDEQLVQIEQMEQLSMLAVSGQKLTAAELAYITDMTETDIANIFAYKSQIIGTEITEMTLSEFLDTATKPAPDNQQLQQLTQAVELAVSETQMDAETFACLFGMEESQVQLLFGLTLAANKTITLPAFTNFLVNDVLTDETYGGGFDEETANQLASLNQMIQLAASDTVMDVASIANVFDMDESMITLIFRLYYGGDMSVKTMSMEELVDFILSDFASDPVLGSYLDSNIISQLQMMQIIIKATINGTTFTYNQLASALGMDSNILKMLFTCHDSMTDESSGWQLSLRTVINFLLNNADTFSSMMDSDALSQLSLAQQMIENSVNGTAYSADKLADLIGMDGTELEQLYLLYFSEHGDTSTWQLPVQTLVNFLNSDVLTNLDYADFFNEDTKSLLIGAKAMIDAVVSGEEYTSDEAYQILSTLTDKTDKNIVELLYLYNAGLNYSDSQWSLSVDQLFNYLCDSVLNDPRFASFIDDDMRSQLINVQETLNEGIEMLKSDSYSRLILYTTLPSEGEDTTAFISALHETCLGFSGNYYLIGNSAMTYEMQQTFDDELSLITMLTSIAIFLIVMLSFRSLVIPLLLVLLVQCSVYITVTVVGVQGYSIYFLALMIVECILMGATIDYGILFTNYYRENRKLLPTKDALFSAYKGSIHTIMTSGLIIVLVTGILGYTTSDPTIGQIARTISTGSLCAIIMILFVLPGILAAFDRLVIRKSKENRKNEYDKKSL